MHTAVLRFKTEGKIIASRGFLTVRGVALGRSISTRVLGLGIKGRIIVWSVTI
jgi:hypothetical protein